MFDNNYIPVLSSQAGASLTQANWQEAGISTAAFHLDELLMKPGLEILQQVVDLHTFTGWKGKLVLNCTFEVPEKEGNYVFRSRYDGSKITFSVETLFEIIQRLNPDSVLLPANSGVYYQQFWQHLNKGMRLYFAADDRVNSPVQRYLAYLPSQTFTQYLHQLEQLPQGTYLLGSFDYFQLKTLLALSRYFVESDSPAADGLIGKAWLEEEILNLPDTGYSNQHQPLFVDCHCRTCKQHFSRAYLHHLILHTPLLCQRLIIQHNVSILSKTTL